MIASPTLLIVDDEPAIRSMLIEFLSTEGYHVQVAEDGAAALAMIARSAPDIVLLDIMMPVMDGWTTLRQLRKNPQTQSLPVLLTSASPVAVEAASLLHANGYAPKPFDFERLVQQIEQILTHPLRPVASWLAGTSAMFTG